MEWKAVAKTVMEWMRQQAEGGRVRQVLGAVLPVGFFTSTARCRAVKHHLSEGLKAEGREATKVLANLMPCDLVFHDDRKSSTNAICMSLYSHIYHISFINVVSDCVSHF